ncbi:zinc finger BED domain-containing protein RICESLEEPER 2-like protein [Tanacetum coccineum]
MADHILPFDIEAEIMERLPVKSLIRFSTDSKKKSDEFGGVCLPNRRVYSKKTFTKMFSIKTTINFYVTQYEDDCSMKIDLDDEFSKFMETQYGEGDDYTEVDIYLKDGAEKRGDSSFDVLGWWNQNMAKFPVLSQVAKHVLAMPISTVASESAFSTGGRVIDKYRSSLTPKTAEALICAQDWLRSTPADLQDMPINGLPLEEMVENLEKLELDMFSNGKKRHNDSSRHQVYS